MQEFVRPYALRDTLPVSG